MYKRRFHLLLEAIVRIKKQPSTYVDTDPKVRKMLHMAILSIQLILLRGEFLFIPHSYVEWDETNQRFWAEYQAGVL